MTGADPLIGEVARMKQLFDRDYDASRARGLPCAAKLRRLRNRGAASSTTSAAKRAAGVLRQRSAALRTAARHNKVAGNYLAAVNLATRIAFC